MKQWLKGVIPDRTRIREHKHLRIFGKLLHDPNLWHLNRRSASGAFAVGMFVMYLPPLGQMVIAAAAAIAFRVNLPISVTLVWITNPITIPPMFYLAYRVGSWILGSPVETFDVEFWLEWRNWLTLVTPMLIGSLVCATLCSAAGYLAIQGIWRWSLVRQIKLRKARLKKTRRSSPQATASGTNRPSSSRHT